MGIFKKTGLFESKRVLEIPVDQLSPNPDQPRSNFSPAALEELAASIMEHGILQPLTIRRCDSGYQLISGERRLRAAKLAGAETVPCILADVDQEESAQLALVENLQRRDLDFLEEALALSQLISTYRLTQEEAARKLGKSQSAIANKLRLLKLSPDALTLLRSKGFTERHARALLSLESEAQQLFAAKQVVLRGMTVAQTENYVRHLVEPKGAKPRRVVLVRDVRLYLNSINRGLKTVQAAGFQAKCHRQETPEAIVLTITLPKEPVSH